MFTGLIQSLGSVAEIRPGEGRTRVVVECDGLPGTVTVGDSISVNGTCLTVAEIDAVGRLHFDAVPETLRVTTLGGLEVGRRVNLEASMTPASLMGGHMVQGHVDGVGRVEQVMSEGEWRVRVGLPEALMEYMIPKGSIAVEGVSLTLASVDVEGRAIEVALIPVTLEKTTLGLLEAGDRVNIECDIIARTTVHWLRHYAARGAGT